MNDSVMHIPVVVVGAGPVGLATALALRAEGLPVVVLESEAEGRQRPGSRAIFLHRESLEHLESLRPGLGWELARNGLVWTTKRTYWRGQLVYERTYPAPDPGRLPHSANLSQARIEALLLDAARAVGVEIAWGQPVTGVDSSPAGVTVRTADGTTRNPAYVVAADGARSTVREAVGLTLEGPRLDNAFVVVDVADDEATPRLPVRSYHYEHPAVGGRNVLLVPFAGGIRADLQLRPGDDPAAFSAPDGVEAWVGRVLPPGSAERVSWVSTYRFSQVVANACSDDAHRTLLVGEAAHLFAPFGARGLNSGIADALVAARAIRQALDRPAEARTAIAHFARTRRDAALYNRDAASTALRHMQLNGIGLRTKRRLASAAATIGQKAGAWLDASPFGPRASAHNTETGSY